MIRGPKWRISNSLRCRLGRHDVWSCIQDSEVDLIEWIEDPQGSKRLPSQTVCGLKLSKKKSEISIAEWAEMSAKLQTARRNRRIYEVSADDKDYRKEKAGARLRLERDDVLVIHAFREARAEGTSIIRHSHDCKLQSTTSINWRCSQSRYGSHLRRKGYTENCHCCSVHKPKPIEVALNIPEARVAVNREWYKSQNLPDRDEQKVKPKTAVVPRCWWWHRLDIAVCSTFDYVQLKLN